jgi:hypothetical protein
MIAPEAEGVDVLVDAFAGEVGRERAPLELLYMLFDCLTSSLPDVFTVSIALSLDKGWGQVTTACVIGHESNVMWLRKGLSVKLLASGFVLKGEEGNSVIIERMIGAEVPAAQFGTASCAA